MQTRIDTGKSTKYQFSSLHELGQYVATAPRQWRQHSSRRDGSYEWDLGVNYDTAVRMARDGWIEGAARMQEALNALPLRTPEPDTRTDVYGFRPHVPRFCAGAPDSMIRHAPKAETGAGRVLTLVVPIWIGAHVYAHCASNFGVAVAQYINQLETDGTRVELSVCGTGRRDKYRASFQITLKNADQPLDLAVIAFAIGHPAMFRRICFALMERSEMIEDAGYYQPARSEADDLINPAPGTVMLQGMLNANSHAPTQEAAFTYVSEQIEEALKAQEL